MSAHLPCILVCIKHVDKGKLLFLHLDLRHCSCHWGVARNVKIVSLLDIRFLKKIHKRRIAPAKAEVTSVTETRTP